MTPPRSQYLSGSYAKIGTGTLFDQFDALLTWIKDADGLPIFVLWQRHRFRAAQSGTFAPWQHPPRLVARFRFGRRNFAEGGGKWLQSIMVQGNWDPRQRRVKAQVRNRPPQHRIQHQIY